MVAHVLRLRIDLLFGALRGDRRHLARTVVGLLALVALLAVASVGALSLRGATADVAGVVVILAGTAVTLGFALAPLIVGAQDPIDPRRFLLFGMPPAALASGLVLAGFVSVPILAAAVVTLAVSFVWGSFGVSVLAIVAAALLGLATCVVSARVAMALVSLAIRERQSRELTGVFILAVIVVVLPVCVFFGSLEWGGMIPPALRSAAEVLAVTPFGAAWAYPARLAGGDPGAVWSLVIALATLVALAAAWFALVTRLSAVPERPAATRDRSTLGWFAVTPGTAGGAVAARSLVYWLRDRRYLANLVAVPVAAALTVVPLVIAGVPLSLAVLVPVPVMALFFGWLPHNDLAYDSTAIWLHLASGVRGLADRIGRIVPALVIAIPVLAISIPIVLSVHGRWAALPGLLGLSICLVLVGLGLSSISSVAAPYAVSRPGESPFQQPQRTGGGGAIAQAGVFLGTVVLAAPVAWWAWLGVVRDPAFGDVALWAGVGIGLVVLVGGVLIGAAVFDRGGGRLMTFAETT